MVGLDDPEGLLQNQWLNDSTNVSGSTLHLMQALLFPGLCKTLGVTSSLSKMWF